MKNFFLKLFLFTLLIFTINLCWIHFMPVEKHIPYVWFMLGFFVIITAMFHFFAMQASKGKPQVFIRYYMGSTTLRLLLYVLLILAYRFYDKPSLIPFALGFMVHYFIFTALEVPILLKDLRRSWKKSWLRPIFSYRIIVTKCLKKIILLIKRNV